MTTSPAERPTGSVDPKLLEILVCPLTKGPLEYDADKQELISRSAKLAYPIRRGLPIMLPEEGRRLCLRHLARWHHSPRWMNASLAACRRCINNPSGATRANRAHDSS